MQREEIILHRLWRGRTKRRGSISRRGDFRRNKEDTSEEITPTISCHELAGISTPQTLKIEGYIKKKKVAMLIDYGSTHNFIHCKLAKVLNCFVYPAP